jgi:hypothetical protein
VEWVAIGKTTQEDKKVGKKQKERAERKTTHKENNTKK